MLRRMWPVYRDALEHGFGDQVDASDAGRLAAILGPGFGSSPR